MQCNGGSAMLGHLVFGRSALIRGGRPKTKRPFQSIGNSESEFAAFARCLARGPRFTAPAPASTATC